MASYYRAGTGRGRSAVAELSLTLLETFSIVHRGRPVPLKNKKAQALLSYLVLSSARSESRERLCGLLWSESPEYKARASLRQTLHQLRENLDQIGFRGLSVQREEVSLDKSSLHVDVWFVTEQAGNQEIHPLLLDRKHLPENLLSGFDEIDPSFRAWLRVQRQSLNERLQRSLEEALAAAGPSLSQIKPIATALLNLDATHEVACRRLMQAYAEQGDVASALKTYKALWDLLEAEYDVEPSPQTQALLVEIKQSVPQESIDPQPTRLQFRRDPMPAAHVADERPQPLAAPQKFIMSVGAFDLSGVSAEKSHVIHGFRHELIACLVRFREWYVRDAAQRPSLPALAVPGATPEYCIQASALEVDGAIRLIVTLREAGSDVYIWSDRYLITLGNWFETQLAVVRRLAVALNVHLSAERLVRVAREHDTTLQVYDRWLRGQALIQNYNPSDWHRAADIFKEIIREVPEFAPAYSSLVQLYNSVHLVHPGVYRNPERQQQALDHAKAAVQIDPLDSRSQLSLGWAYAMAKQYSQAELYLSLAHDLNENDPWTLVSSAQGFAYCGDLERAQHSADQALHLSLMPSRSHWGYQVGTRFLCGDYQGCIEAADRAMANTPNLPGWKASALFHLGAKGEAREEARRFVELLQSRWFGTDVPTEEAISRWFLHLFPIKQREHWERLRDGLAGAGVKIGAVRHHGW